MIKKQIVRFLLAAIVVPMASLLTTSCDDSFIFNDEGDCSTKVKFVYKFNRQALRSSAEDGIGPDAFDNTVSSVHLFVFDAETDELVLEKFAYADELMPDITGVKNTMSVDLEAGNYTFLAWCGFDPNDENNAFELQHNYTRATDNLCKIKMEDKVTPVHKEQYESVFYGKTENVEIKTSDMGKTIEVSLIKDTNDISVWIQHPYAKFSEGEFQVFYQDDNGVMQFADNTVVKAGENMTYKSHTNYLFNSDSEYNGEQIVGEAMIAHFSVSRLLASNVNTARIVITDKNGFEIFSIPFIKYVLEMQTFTRPGTAKSDQWYLDCEDTYTCSFYFTGYDTTWVAARIIINNWVIVPDQDEDVTGPDY